jgi:glycosyltransferase involved in cell wall biosynthesis
MRVVQINNSQETFTATASGAIATHIWETCRAGMELGERPLVISQDAPESPLPDVPCIWVPGFDPLRTQAKHLALRVRKKLGGWRSIDQPSYVSAVVRSVRMHALQSRDWILHNDPELAVCLHRRFPRTRIRLHFHNPISCDKRFASAVAASSIELSAVSGYVAREVVKIYGKKCSRVVWNGVNSDVFCPAPSRVLKQGGLEICFLGRTGIEKGADLLLKACVRLASEGFRFGVRLIGSNHWGRWERDSYQDQLADLCAELQTRGVCVTRTGHVARADIPDQLQRADIYVLPSRWQEPCALSLLEGMASGLAVVASRTGGTPEVLGDAGLFFNADDALDLASKLRELLENPHRVRALGSQARRRACELTWRKTWEDLTRSGGDFRMERVVAPRLGESRVEMCNGL